MSSLFSKIINRDIPGRIIYEDDHVIAFLDIHPVNPGHTLVVPKNEQPNILESSEEDLMHVLRVVRTLAPAIVKAVGADGFNIVTNTGEASGQSIFHTHFHIIPRFNNDGHMPWALTAMSASQLDEVAAKIKNHL